tara:strand:+ start:160 stop:669 length:510 start_codon:yes stop_codon:yes gene_type:complete
MIFNTKKHNDNLYNSLLGLSRNIFFYKEIKLSDSFETRIYLMFFHFSIIMKIFKKKGSKFDQSSYDSLFRNIENNLRELGFGDVSVNKKMKDMNKLLYDILLKIDEKDEKANVKDIKINQKVVMKYFKELNDTNSESYKKFERYLIDFYNFCFDISLDNMIRDIMKFKK